MSRQLSSRATVSLLKQEAKRWHAALRRDDPDARQRLRLAWPQAPADAALRDVQHALAREYGSASWVALLDRLDDLAVDRRAHDDRVALVLSHGWTGEVSTARRIVARDATVRRASVFTAAACGDLEEVRRRLQLSPDVAMRVCAERGWTALAHVMYGRLDDRHAPEISRQLLDAGADVHFAFDDGWGNPFTLLTGVAGDGEGAKVPHPQARELAQLLLERGADPFDTQLLYNTSLHHDDTSWLELLWTACEQRGTTDQWRRTDARSLGGKWRLCTLDYLLGNAVTRHHRVRVRWLLDHGADARTVHAYTGRRLHTEARLNGFGDGVAMLEAHGARAEPLSPEQTVVAAVLTGDEETLARVAREDPALLQRAAPLHAVALHGRVDVAQRLLELGADVHAIDHEGATPLHRAVQGGSLPMVMALVAAGADVNRRENRFHGTALSWAVVLGQDEVAEWLVPRSRDVRALARLGEIERLEEILRKAPELSKEMLPNPEAPTALFCFADDDETAAVASRLLLAHGADGSVRDGQGRGAADVARSRGLDETARVIEHAR